MILFINASPKLKKSNSKYFCDLLKIDNSITNYIYSDDFNKIIENIDNSNTIIFAFPTYVDIVPSKLIEFIEKYKGNFYNKNVYAIVNCGFLESMQNNLSIEFIKNYIEEKKGIFKGYLSIGSGEIIKITKTNKFLKIITVDFFSKIKKFKNAIIENKFVNLNCNVDFITKKSFCAICNKFWNKKING